MLTANTFSINSNIHFMSENFPINKHKIIAACLGNKVELVYLDSQVWDLM